MNNQKQQKPTLTGQRFKTRKRGLCLPLLPCMCPAVLVQVLGLLSENKTELDMSSRHQMKRRDLTLLSFKKVSYKA